MSETKGTEWKLLRNMKTIRTSDPKVINGKYLAEDMVKHWTEDFVDEDTKEPISIERNEIIKRRGIKIEADEMSSVLFYLQCGDVDYVCVCNETIRVNRYNPTYHYMYEIVISTTVGKDLYLVHANSIENAIVVLENWLAFYSEYDGEETNYSVVSVKRVNYVSNEQDPDSGEDNDDQEGPEEVDDDNDTFYKAVVKRSWSDVGDKPKSSCHVVIEKAQDVGEAKVLALSFAKDTLELEDYECKYTVVSAQPYKAKAVVPKEYSDVVLNVKS